MSGEAMLSFRVSSDELAILRVAAKQRGVSLSDFIRRAIRRALPRPPRPMNIDWPKAQTRTALVGGVLQIMRDGTARYSTYDGASRG